MALQLIECTVNGPSDDGRGNRGCILDCINMAGQGPVPSNVGLHQYFFTASSFGND